MYGSPATSRDLNLAFEVASDESQKEEEENLRHRHQQMSSGLSRYRSATALIGETGEDFFTLRSSATETEATAARFTSPNPREQIGGKSPTTSGAAISTVHRRLHLMTATGTEHRQKAGSSSSTSPMMYYSLPRDQLLPHRSTSVADQEIRPESLNNSNLVRQSSSATGLFSELSLEQGEALMGGVLEHWTGSSGEATPTGSRRLKSRTSIPPRQFPSLDLMSHISELPGLPISSWEDPSLLSDGFVGSLRRIRDPPENREAGIHFSLSKTSPEMASLLQFQDAVPCKIRAKRGCATHPRSIAERERRTRISERIKKLQELVPNMDKQLSTAEMLDMALDYIRDLQEQVKKLSKSKADCTCPDNDGV
ncbi:unnamed protein product [Spirodela intermedia]|uniref:BHLH domain-containing protein n=1 Tax=Spirodela intermedia TaxID=51605 RepID=A0A7I8LJM6_SPIIN|nr:unnamed protein product [Spirodela intermedia]